MTTSKKTVKDFKLISNITKARIKGLIEKRLTTQTIALFAQEYENYDAAIRLEIMEFIFFLLENEEQELTEQYSPSADARSRMVYDRKKMEFDQKKTNFLKIKKILADDVKNENVNLTAVKKNNVKFKDEQKTYDLGSPVSKKNENKKTQLKKPNLAENKNSNIAKMIKEAEEREKKALKLAEEKLRHEQAQIAAEKKRVVEEKERIAAEKRRIAEEKKLMKTEKNNVKKKKEEKDLEKEVKISNIDRDYEKEQREKEKLWLELYGKTREESLKERNTQKASDFKPSGNDDKRPIIELDIDPADFKIGDDLYLVDEVTNPKNRCYLFWTEIKQKYGVPSIYILIKSKPMNVLQKINRQRKAYEKRLRRQGGTVHKAETIKKINTTKTKR